MTQDTTKKATCTAAATSGRIRCNNNDALKIALLAESITWGGNNDNNNNNGNSFASIPQGCQFSPDGTCLLTAKANRLELYNTPYENDDNNQNDDDEKDGVDGDNDNDNDNDKTNIKNDWVPAITCNGGE